MKTIHHLVFWILVVCRYTWSQRVDGRYSQRSSWSACSKSCDGGKKYRSRSCTNPRPANGGRGCWRLGPPVDSRICDTTKCPVDGRYSQWSSWSACSKSCDGGTKYRFRSCTNPPPTNGGRYCWRLGPPVESQNCNTQKCPVHGGYSQWSYWSHCTQSCGGGRQRRHRSCTNPPPANGGKDCRGLGQATKSRKCNTFGCPVDGRYSQWSSWSACSESCDGGKKYRYRSCTSPPPANGGRYCRRLGPPGESQICNTHKCPVHGGYSHWSSWSQCSRSCDGGAKHRNRSCNNPRPAYGGKSCWSLGKAVDSRKCNTFGCPVDGHYLQWSSWSACSQSCDGGKKYRYRSCTNPPPANGGRYCWRLGPPGDSQICNTHKCSGNVYGGYSQWSYWSQCSQSCGGGTQHRNRSCTNLPPASYGRDCNRLGQVTESRKCNSSVCPDPPNFLLVSPLVTSVSVGKTARFTCNASGMPLPTIRWMRQSEIAADNVKYQVISSAGSSQLIIKDVSVDDQGYYTCFASSYEYHSQRSFLGVLTLFKVRHEDLTPLPTTTHRATAMGQSVTLYCPEVTWPFPDEIEWETEKPILLVTPKSKCVTWTFPDGTVWKTGKRVLLVTPKSKGDFGTYTCTTDADPVVFSINLRQERQSERSDHS